MDFVQRAAGIAGDESFGPQLGSQFDLTLLFEHTILTILPTSLFIVASPIYFFYYLKSPTYVSTSFLLWAKILLSVALLGVETANLVLWSTSPAFRSDPSLAASSLVWISTLCIVPAVILEHRRSLRSSAAISVYLSLTLLLDVVKSRSYLSRPGLEAAGGLSAAAAAIKLAIVLLQEVPKRTRIKDPALRESLSKETTSGFWNRSLFLWLNTIFLLGFKRTLRFDDLGYLGDDFAAEYLSTKFEPIWKKCKHSSHGLLRSCLLTLLRPFLVVAIPRLLYTAFTFSQPLLLRRIVGFIGEETSSISVRNGLIGATVLIYLGLAITGAGYNHLNNRLVTLVRGVLISEIFKKTLTIDQSEAKDLASATLMSTDVEGISLGLRVFHDIFATVIEVGIGIYLLTTVVGKASFLIIFPAIASAIAAFEIGRRLAPALTTWNKEIQNRVSVTSSMLPQVKSIKMMGLQSVVTDLVQQLRETEIGYSKKFRIIQVIMKASILFCYQITAVIVMTAAILWTTLSNGLIAAQVFTALAIVVITALSIARLMQYYPTLMSAVACFERIQVYLQLDDMQDSRQKMSDLVLLDSNDSEKHSSGGSVSQTEKALAQLPTDQSSIVFIDASIAAATGKDPILKRVNVSVTRSKLALVLGRTGSGKSTFLKSIIGEASITDGSIYVEQRQIAYCDQSPWLRNISVRDNIIGENVHDVDWYQTVLEACLLSHDIIQWPHGDLTKSGDGGSNLSGGQKQRVALARAVYSQSPILVLDNVLSALDHNTADAIFCRLFATGGLLRRLGRTVVMTIHSAECVSSADQTLVIGDDGSIKSALELRDVMQVKNDVTEWFHPNTGNEGGRENAETISLSEKTCEQHFLPAGDELPSRQRGDFRLYSFYLKSTAKWLWIVWLITVLFVSLAERLPEIFLRIWLEAAPDNKVYIAGYILFGFSSFIAVFTSLSLYFLKIVPDSSEKLHRLLLDTIMRSTLSFFSTTSNGSILNLFSQDMTLISQDLPLTFFRLVYSFFMILLDIGIIAAGATYVAIIIPFIAGSLYLIQFFYLRTSRQLRYIDLEAKTPLYTQFSEISTGLMHIRSSGLQTQALSQSLKLLDYSQKPFYYMFCIQRWLALVAELIVLGVATVLVSVALCYKSTTSQNGLGLSLLTLIQFGDSIISLLNTWIATETSLGAIARIRSMAEDTPVEEDHCNIELPPGCLKRGAIEMVGVTARYHSSVSVSSPTALDNVSIDVKPGQRVAVVGRTGSGKSSLILTILNFLNFTGTVKIDGTDLTEIPRQHLRNLITTIPQDFVELPGTVRYNISPMTQTKPVDHTHDVLLSEALERVRLKDYVDAQGGLDARLADMGLSHGQRQLLAIARAILHKLENDSSILLVDEATSGLDVETAEVMEEVMNDVFGKCTVIAISHRPKNVANADVVLDVQNGRITVRDAPQVSN